MTAPQVLDPDAREAAAPSAVVWIDEGQAFVAAMSREGAVSTCEVSRGWLSETAYLAQVVRVIGDRQRVMILGPSSIRLLLEREYVSVLHRPDHLVDVEPEGPITVDELVARVRALAA